MAVQGKSGDIAEGGGWFPRADTDEDEVLNAFLASVITIKVSQASMLRGRIQGEELMWVRVKFTGKNTIHWRNINL